MSKISCGCGHIIRDDTDFISYKGCYIADQDYFDLLDKLETCPRENISSVMMKYTRGIYQCQNCNSVLMFTDSQHFHEFKANSQDSNDMLVSCHSGRWQGFLRGYYSSDKSEIYWTTNKHSDFITDLTRNELESLYHQKFTELYTLGVLRSAFLTVNGVITHQYDNE